MLYIILFFLELSILFLLSKRVHKQFGEFLLRLTHSNKLTVYIMALLFLPGTFVHEMSHFLMALVLLVPVGNMELMPKVEDGGIRLGSVAIAKTDPVRRFLIGISPFMVGTLLILLIIYYFSFNGFSNGALATLLVGYLIFTISNTMFSSRRDLEGSWILLVIFIFVLLLLWIFRINVNINIGNSALLTDTFGKANIFLIIPVLLDIITLVSIKKITGL